MFIKRLLVLLILCVPYSVANDDAMIKTIRDVEPDRLIQLLIPGFFLDKRHKNRCLTAAEEMTNKTFKELNSFSIGDIGSIFVGTLKVGAGLLAGAAAYFFWYKRWDWDTYGPLVDGIRPPIRLGVYDQDSYRRYATLGTLGILSSYFVLKGLDDYSAVLTRRTRQERHRNALAIEGLIHRLPVCESTPAEIPVARPLYESEFSVAASAA